MTQPTPNDMPHQALATVREGLPSFDDLYAVGIDEISLIWHQLRWEEGIDNDVAAAMLAVGVYQVNAPEPQEEA